jgi:hypothetical protein
MHVPVSPSSRAVLVGGRPYPMADARKNCGTVLTSAERYCNSLRNIEPETVIRPSSHITGGIKRVSMSPAAIHLCRGDKIPVA